MKGRWVYSSKKFDSFENAMTMLLVAPFHIFRLDPMFNAAFNFVAKKPEGPKTEADQSLYNMLLETYGTHYVTHAIVGAIAHLFTLISDAFAKSSSFEEIYSQASGIGRFFFVSNGGGDFSHSVQQAASESFRKNSQYFVEYQPVVQTIPGKNEWQ